ncbi:MAG: hypothetical protein JWQ53_578, partial [Klenkia sp.]|nr:hypothetical protein [Klenkia sp.]
HGDRRLTWAQTAEQSRTLARALLARGVGRGDSIALWLPNHPEWLLLWLAAVRIGAAVVPVNTRYTPDEAAYVLEQSQARLLVVEADFLGLDHPAAFAAICPDWDGAHSDRLPDLRGLVVVGGPPVPGALAFGDLVACAGQVDQETLDAVTRDVVPTDPVAVVYTSGTTGRPKGVVHTHAAVAMMRAVGEVMDYGPDDVVLGHLPLFHVSGLFSSFLPTVLTGAAYVALDVWDAGVALRLVADEGVTVLSGIPTHFIDLLHHPDLPGTDTSRLRTGWIGGSTLPAEVLAGARDTLGMQALLPVYGMTELTSTTTLGRPDDPVDSLLAGKGLPLGGYDVALVDPVTRAPVPVGTEGEIVVRGYVVMRGYHRDPGATAAVLDDEGWFRTGDLGVFDERGYLAITGRLSDMLIVGGFNVHPADVEHVLTAHPDVVQAHVVARPDARLGEVPVAFVECRTGSATTPADLMAYCRGRLAGFKVPREIRFPDSWPTTPTGKVQRFRLRELAAQSA